MKPAWKSVEPMDARTFESVRRRAIFECCKWDPQVEDVSTLSPQPVLLDEEVWQQLSEWSRRLSHEILTAEKELLRRHDLHEKLGLPRAIRKALSCAAGAADMPPGVRVIRFDFHFTTEGWKISEANTDVPGGFNEASGFSRLMGEFYHDAVAAGDPAGALVDAIADSLHDAKPVALVHATAFADDRQVMVYLSRRLAERGIQSVLVGPDHLRWRNGRASICADWFDGDVGFAFRFFPAEWLPNLPSACDWRNLFCNAATPLCNPATALMTQSKRFPLIWNELEADLPTWLELLPETRDPTQVPHEQALTDWVFKPALGRIGDSIAIGGVTRQKDWQAIRESVCKQPTQWIAQRRFEAIPMETPDGSCYPCIGVYTINGIVAGAYGRLAQQPLIDHRAADAAILIASASPSSTHENPGTTDDILAIV